MKRTRQALVALALAMVPLAVWLTRRDAATAAVPENRRLQLNGHVVELPAGKLPYAESPEMRSTVRGTRTMFVQLEAPVGERVRRQVEATGVRVLGVIPPCGLVVEADVVSARKAGSLPGVKAVRDAEVADKLDPRLDLDSARLQAVTVRPLSPDDAERLREQVLAAGGNILEEKRDPRLFRVELSGPAIVALAHSGEVRWIERYVRPRFLNDVAVNAGLMSVRPVWQTHGLTGRGQFITTSDTGIDTGDLTTMHPDLVTNLVGFARAQWSCYATDVSGHGTHTAGSLVGDGAASGGQIRGTAPAAKLWAWFCCGSDGYVYTPDELSSLLRPSALTQGTAYIHSASWGGDMNVYNDNSRDLDDYVWKHPDFLPVFSAGNGWLNAANYVTNVERAICCEAAAKNVLAVGASENLRPDQGGYADNPDELAYFSSRGPMPDGRIKPDLVAPGTYVLSTRSSQADAGNYAWGIYNDRYAYNGGTSMSCPLVAGAVALVRQWLVERRGYTNDLPTAALMKAVVTGGATEMFGAAGGNVTAAAPNSEEGWGRIDLEGSLYPTNGLAVRLYDRIPFFEGSGQQYEFSLTNDSPFVAQLVWIDAPAEPSAALSLVNDLDLVVSNRTSGAVFSPNDHTNNLEALRFESLPLGDYAVIVRGTRVAYDSDEGGAAALYLRGALAAEDSEPVMVKLTVATEQTGTAAVNPEAGEHYYPRGTEVQLKAGSASDSFDYWTNRSGRVVARLPFAGFEGSGSVPATGVTNVVVVTLEEDSSIVWRWSGRPSDYAFRLFCSGEHGYNDAQHGRYYYLWYDEAGNLYNDYLQYADWLPAGTNFTLRIPDDLAGGEALSVNRLYDRFWNYSISDTLRLAEVDVGDGNDDYKAYYEQSQLPSEVSVTMDQARDVVAWYVNERLTVANGTLPYWWYLCKLAGSDDGTDAYLDGGDPDGDGFANLQEYEKDTNPISDASFPFEIARFSPTNLSFTGSVKGKLVVERCDQLGGEWHGVWTNDSARTATTNQVDLSASFGPGFYRVIHQP